MLTARRASVKEERNSRKEPFSEAEVKKLIASVNTVTIAKGKKSVTWKSAEVGPADLRGPTGNFRAPMIRKGKTLLVGFSEEQLTRLLR